ncbi:unnamed protein product [Echinostoma caproni]|uniref:Thioredoxin domain-containing protein 9 n=1 Tax=Echinostoma caproni TaxID=27848 RepID=A0A183B3P7_9TREM|nr:unnamed protein product [Echinostoma caproni]
MSQPSRPAIPEQALESHIIKAAQVLEETLDEEINRLDNLNEDDLETIRLRRLKQMKEENQKRNEWLAAGHGSYSELANEKEFFAACKRSTYGLVCHFYRDATFRCKIVDKHLTLLAPKHIECRMCKINAEKAPFLTQRLNVFVIPTLILVKNEQICDRIVGFDDLGGHDEFSTAMMEWRLAVGQVIRYSGDLSNPPDTIKSGITLDSRRKGIKTIRDKGIGDDDDDDDSD